MQFSFFGALGSILASSGFASFAEDPRSLIMIIIACVLLYMGIGKKFEPLLLVPIAFGMLLANLPLTGLLNAPVDDSSPGMLWVFYQGVQHAIYPSIIFLGIGAMTDFGPLIARPSSLLLGAAAQLGIFSAFRTGEMFSADISVVSAYGISRRYGVIRKSVVFRYLSYEICRRLPVRKLLSEKCVEHSAGCIKCLKFILNVESSEYIVRISYRHMAAVCVVRLSSRLRSSYDIRELFNIVFCQSVRRGFGRRCFKIIKISVFFLIV